MPGQAEAVPCHLLIYVEVSGLPAGGVPIAVDDDASAVLLTRQPDQQVLQNGRYAVVHWVPESPFLPLPSRSIYGYTDSYRVNQHCSIVSWSAKVGQDVYAATGDFTEAKYRRLKKKPPHLALIHLDRIDRPCIAVSDPAAECPHMWLFLAPKTGWPQLFEHCMTTTLPTGGGGADGVLVLVEDSDVAEEEEEEPDDCAAPGDA